MRCIDISPLSLNCWTVGIFLSIVAWLCCWYIVTVDKLAIPAMTLIGSELYRVFIYAGYSKR